MNAIVSFPFTLILHYLLWHPDPPCRHVRSADATRRPSSHERSIKRGKTRHQCKRRLAHRPPSAPRHWCRSPFEDPLASELMSWIPDARVAEMARPKRDDWTRRTAFLSLARRRKKHLEGRGVPTADSFSNAQGREMGTWMGGGRQRRASREIRYRGFPLMDGQWGVDRDGKVGFVVITRSHEVLVNVPICTSGGRGILGCGLADDHAAPGS